MQKLFFELIRVALGRLDCVERAPLIEEWPALYRMSQEQHLVATCYHGVERLFEFGLRGPQDLMLDWMAEAEEATDADVIESYDAVALRNVWKNWRWQRWLRRHADHTDAAAVQLLCLVAQAHEAFAYRRLLLRPLLDADRLLRQLADRPAAFADGRPIEVQLKAVGLHGFAQGLMWVLSQVTGLETRYMACQPNEAKGRLILADIMGDGHGIKHRLRKLFA